MLRTCVNTMSSASGKSRVCGESFEKRRESFFFLVPLVSTRGSYCLPIELEARVRVEFHCRVIFARVNEKEAVYEKATRKRKTFTYTRDLPYIVSILFKRVKFMCVRT